MLAKAHIDNHLMDYAFGSDLNPTGKLRSFLLVQLILLIFSPAWSKADSIYRYDSEAIIATVNQHSLTAAELSLHIEQSRTEVISIFIREHNLSEISPGFWEQDFKGIKPFDLLKEIALRKAIQTKIKLVYMHAQGIIDSPDYNHFLGLFNEFCKDRDSRNREMVKYGPLRFSESDYFQYWFANAIIELKNRIYYENEARIPVSSGNKEQAGDRFSSLNNASSNDRRTEEEIENILRERLGTYELNAEISINQKLLNDITPSF